jgi:hypothetical protein
MRTLAIISLLLFTAATCQEVSDKALGKRKAARVLMQFAAEDTLTWRLVQVYDPYQQNTYSPGDEGNPSFLRITRKGKFAEYDTLNYREGRWFLDTTRTKIRLAYTHENKTKIERADRDPYFRFQLVKLTKDSLVLGVQGRHGIVERTYLLERPPALSSDSLSLMPPPLPLEKANKTVLPDSTQDTVFWQLQQIFDPYVLTLPKDQPQSLGGKDEIIFPNNPHYLLFCRSGQFIEKDTLNYALGSWYLNPSRDRLGLIYSERNGKPIVSRPKALYRWEIQHLSSDSMILGIQGRHGIVKHTYRNVSREQSDRDE